jgi:glycyl-tRNA synthetase beta chain
VAEFAGGEDFEPFVIAFKRAANILATAEEDFEKASIDQKLFDHEAEGALLQAVEGIEAKVAELVEKSDHLAALSTIASIRPQVDNYFDGPLVMHENPKVRINRLATLNRVGKLFANIADFKKM